MTLSTYARLFEELEGTETRSAEDEIRRAREAARGSCTHFVPASGSQATGPEEKLLLIPQSRRPDSNRGPLHYEVRAGVTTSHQGSPQVTRYPKLAGLEMTHDDW
jgi:hypothetical protein